MMQRRCVLNQCSHFSGRTGDIACIVVVMRDLPTLALRDTYFGGYSVMVWGGISLRFKMHLVVVIAGNLTTVR